jgi:hypothetical protein
MHMLMYHLLCRENLHAIRVTHNAVRNEYPESEYKGLCGKFSFFAVLWVGVIVDSARNDCCDDDFPLL